MFVYYISYTPIYFQAAFYINHHEKIVQESNKKHLLIQMIIIIP